MSLDNKNIDNVLSYLGNIYNQSNFTTQKRYIVILYGPPASGKCLARKIACYYIGNNYEKNVNYEEIMNSFIDTCVDKIVRDIIDCTESTNSTNSTDFTNTINDLMINNDI